MRQKGSALLPVIIIILLMGALGYFLYKNVQLQKITGNLASPSIVPTISLPKPVPIPTSSPISLIDDRSKLIQYLTEQYYNQGKQYGRTLDQVTINISKLEGNYATGTGGFTTGGGDIWFATKISGNWFLVQQTQEPPDCKLMTQYNFPKSIYGDCI